MTGIVVQYKGFLAFARYFPEDGYYHGSLENVEAHATFGGETIDETVKDFQDLVNDYLSLHQEDSGSNNKLVIDMSDYSFQSYQPVSLQFAEG